MENNFSVRINHFTFGGRYVGGFSIANFYRKKMTLKMPKTSNLALQFSTIFVLIDGRLIPTLAVFQLYRGVNKFYINLY